MKKIEAIIKPFKFEDVKQALLKLGLRGMSVYEIQGCGMQHGQVEFYSLNDASSDPRLELIPKLKIELVVHDDKVEETVNTISQAAHTGRIGDGKIFVYDVVDACRIRTRERGEAAIG